MINSSLLRNNRFYVLVFSFLLSVGLFFVSYSPPGISSNQVAFLTRWYALTAALFLYLALLATPLTRLFITLSFRGQYIFARRAIGVSAFYFGFLHMLVAFFGELGGFNGLGFLDSTYIIAITFSFTALFILFLMTLTSTDKMVARLTFPKWKLLHRFVYLAGVLIIVHVLLLGSNFASFSDPIYQISFVLLVFLLGLEALRFDRFLKQRFVKLPQIGIATLILLCLLLVFVVYEISRGAPPGGVHEHHVLSDNTVSSDLQNMPGMQGDRSLRYNVSFDKPPSVQANTPVNLAFRVYDASNGNLVPYFTYVYEKLMHVIVVDNTLSYFSHEHPVFAGNTFTLHTTFPHGLYRIYTTFAPLGAVEQQFAFTVAVGEKNDSTTSSTQAVDKSFQKKVGDLDVSLESKAINADEINTSLKSIDFTLTDSHTQQPVTTLEPYLGAFGHLTLINQQDYSFFHFHPKPFRLVADNQRGGPTVSFVLMNQYQSLKAGVYRAFAEFKYHGIVRTADFTINIS